MRRTAIVLTLMLAAALTAANSATAQEVRKGGLLDVIGAQDPENLTIRSRVRVLQGSADGTVIPTFTNRLVDELRGRGTKLAYTTYDGVSHAGVIEAGGGDATRWIAKRLG